MSIFATLPSHLAINHLMKHNFNAGPSILPKVVFEEASRAILDFNGTGLSILEIGHRTPIFEAVLEEAVSLVRDLMQLTDIRCINDNSPIYIFPVLLMNSQLEKIKCEQLPCFFS